MRIKIFRAYKIYILLPVSLTDHKGHLKDYAVLNYPNCPCTDNTILEYRHSLPTVKHALFYNYYLQLRI